MPEPTEWATIACPECHAEGRHEDFCHLAPLPPTLYARLVGAYMEVMEREMHPATRRSRAQSFARLAERVVFERDQENWRRTGDDIPWAAWKTALAHVREAVAALENHFRNEHNFFMAQVEESCRMHLEAMLRHCEASALTPDATPSAFLLYGVDDLICDLAAFRTLGELCASEGGTQDLLLTSRNCACGRAALDELIERARVLMDTLGLRPEKPLNPAALPW